MSLLPRKVLEDREEAVRKVTDRMEADLNLLGATGVEDLLQDGVQETLESLRVAGIKVLSLYGRAYSMTLAIMVTICLSSVWADMCM